VQALKSTDLLLNCIKYGNFNLWKIIKIVATRCQILRLKCTKFDFGWGSAPDVTGELTLLPQTPCSWILGGLLLRGEERKGREGWRGRGEDKAGEGKGPLHPLCIGPPQCVDPALRPRFSLILSFRNAMHVLIICM
jgi:hypothetical protein